MIEMNYEQARKIMKTAKNPAKGKPIGNNTRLYDNDGYYTIRLHNNVIMEIYPDGFFPMDAGWKTVTTKARLNEHMPIGRIHQKDFDWYYTIGDNEYYWRDVYYVCMHPDQRDDPVVSVGDYRASKEMVQ